MGTFSFKSIFSRKPDKDGSTRKVFSPKEDAKSFHENQVDEEAFDSVSRGIASVPLDRITGSVGRYNDFDGEFRIKKHIPSDRLENIRHAMRQGKRLPPIKLYQIKDEYYVLDGNHRVAAAKEFGLDKISAHILEFIPSKNTLENLVYRERSSFHAEMELHDTIELTEIGQYDLLRKQILEHQDYLLRLNGEDIPLKTAADDWYKTIYIPLVSIIEKGGLNRHFPKRTIADLYAYISFYQWVEGRKRKYGIGIDKQIPKNMEEFRKKMAGKETSEYPDMRRGITAFVLINVKSKSEFRIMDKLFVHKEVKELHTIHGDVDILAKIVLTRDLLSSDAEIIGKFVHDNIRGISGVSSTQTLIPGSSKIRE